MRLLLGSEAGDPAEDTVNVFEEAHQTQGHVDFVWMLTLCALFDSL